MFLGTTSIANFYSYIAGLWDSNLLENSVVLLSYSSLRKFALPKFLHA